MTTPDKKDGEAPASGAVLDVQNHDAGTATPGTSERPTVKTTGLRITSEARDEAIAPRAPRESDRLPKRTKRATSTLESAVNEFVALEKWKACTGLVDQILSPGTEELSDERCHQTAELLMKSRDAIGLALLLNLGLLTRSRTSEHSQKILGALREKLLQSNGVPRKEGDATSQVRVLLEWLSPRPRGGDHSSGPTPPSGTNDATVGGASLVTTKLQLVLLLLLTETKAGIAREVLSKFIEGEESWTPGLSDERKMLSAIVALLGLGTTKPEEVELGGLLAFARPLVGGRTAELKIRVAAERKLEAEVARLEQVVASLGVQVAEVQASATDLRAQLDRALRRSAELEAGLNEAAAIAERKEEQWKSELRSRLAGQAARLKAGLSLEIEEALASLDRQDPNIRMGVSRVKEIRRILQDFEKT